MTHKPMSAESIRRIEARALRKAREYLLRNGYKSDDFFTDVRLTRANNVRQRRAEIEEGEDRAYARPEVCLMVWHLDAGQDTDFGDGADGMHEWP